MAMTISSLLTGILLVWFIISILFVIGCIQDLIRSHRQEKRRQSFAAREQKYLREREKREREQAAYDLEYHEKRMKE